MKKHFFIIVNYNSGNNILECIDSILHSKNIKPHIIIVDNASRDSSLENCKNKYPNLNYLYNTHNIGFAAGANIGARFALERGAETITFCNPDAILDEDCANILITTILNAEGSIVSPIIYKSNSSSIWFEGGKISFWDQKATHVVRNNFTTHLSTTDYISGCVMTVSAEVFEKIGLFDERFFLYYEDADFSLRARKAKFKLVVNSDAKAYHKEVSEQENAQKIYFLVLSGLLFFNKHSEGFQKILFNIKLKLRKLKNKSNLKKNKPGANQVFKAFTDYEKQK